MGTRKGSLAVLAILTIPICNAFSLFRPDSQRALLFSDDRSIPGNNSFKYCEDPKDYHFIFDELNIDPNPPKAGKNITVTGSGDLERELKNGSTFVLDVKLKAGAVKVPVLRQEIDICESLSSNSSSTGCPLKKGTLEVEQRIEIPEEVKGTYVVSGLVFDEEGEEVVCVTTSVKF